MHLASMSLNLLLVHFAIVLLHVTCVSSAVPSDSELSCSSPAFPCFRTRYLDLILDFARHSDFVVPPTPSGSAYRSHSAYANALQGQEALPILNALCLTPTATMAYTRVDADDSTPAATTTTMATTLSSIDASVLSTVRTFSEYQQVFASQSVPYPSAATQPAPAATVAEVETTSGDRTQKQRLFGVLDGNGTATNAPPPMALGAPLTRAVCLPAAYGDVVQGTQGSLPNASTTAFRAVPGVRLMPFRGNGGRVFLPYGNNQFLVTLAVIGSGVQAKALYDLFAAFGISDDVSAADLTKEQARYFYRCCGLRSVYWLDTAQYEALYLNRNANTAPSLFAPVGFGGAISDGLSVSWVLLLVVGTCLAGIIVYALCVRRQADAVRAAVDAGEKGGADGEGGDGGDDDEVATDDDEELQLTEADQLIQHNLTTVWQERDLKAELNESVRQKKAASVHNNHGTTDEAGNPRALVPLHDDGHGTASVVRRGAGQRGFARVQLLPTSSFFEEAFETSADFALPPETDEDEAAFQRRLKHVQARDQVRRRREEEAALSLIEMQRTAAGAVGGAVSNISPNQQAKVGGGSAEDIDALMALPPEAVGGLDASWDDPTEDTEEMAAARQKQQEEAERKKPKPLGLAARRMATMMGNMKFAAVPSGVLRLPSRHELVGKLAGGSAASHLAMAAESDDATERLMRARFSKLYFAPQALVDQPAYDSDDSDGSPANSPRARGPMRHQEIFKNLESSASPHNARTNSGSPQPPARPLREIHDELGKQQPGDMQVEL